MDFLLGIYLSLFLALILWAFLKFFKIRNYFFQVTELGSWKKSWLDFLILFWILIGSFIASPILLGKIFTYWNLESKDDTLYLLSISLGGHLITLIVFLVTLNRGKNILDWGYLDGKAISWKQGLYQGGFLFLVSYPSIVLVAIIWKNFLSWMIRFGLIDSAPHQEVLGILMGLEDSLEKILFIILAVVFAPILEELLFRGALFRFLVNQWGFWIAALCSGFCFAMIHFSWFAFVSLWWVGILLAWAYWKSGSIKTAIVFHACFNANTCVIALFGGKDLL